MIKHLLLFVFFCLQFRPIIAQKLEYDIVKGEKIIGKVLAEKKSIDDTTVITITSEAKFKLLFSFNVSYLLEEKFVDDILVSGKAINYLNDKIQKKSEVRKLENKYVVNLDEEISEFELSKITYSISNLYFEQPPKLDITIFSQQFASFLALFNESNNEYKLESPNGNNNYNYEDGILKKVKISRSYANFYFKLRE